MSTSRVSNWANFIASELTINELELFEKMLKKRDSECYFVPTHILIITLVKKMCKTTLADCFHK